MTAQLKHFIDISDIVSLRMQCRHCEATLSLPISEKMEVQPLRTCPSCNEPWASLPSGNTIENPITDLAKAIKVLERVKQARDEWAKDPNRGFSISLEIKADAAPLASGRVVVS